MTQDSAVSVWIVKVKSNNTNNVMQTQYRVIAAATSFRRY